LERFTLFGVDIFVDCLDAKTAIFTREKVKPLKNLIGPPFNHPFKQLPHRSRVTSIRSLVSLESH